MSYEKGIVIATKNSNLHFWDLNLATNYKTLNLKILNHKFYSRQILSLQIEGQKLIIVTNSGDVVQVYLPNYTERMLATNYKFRSEKIKSIFSLKGSTKALCLQTMVKFSIFIGIFFKGGWPSALLWGKQVDHLRLFSSLAWNYWHALHEREYFSDGDNTWLGYR